jgi:energy-coupling factor transporter ATP-binding protein EcfA2
MQFRRLELAVHREQEAKGHASNFQPYVDRLNSLLDNIVIQRSDPTFKLISRSTGQEVPPAHASSGEAELVSLGIEILMFATELMPEKRNFLFLDEPDVHLHPDLQGRLVAFLVEAVNKDDFTVVIATHSTAILGGLAEYEDAAVAFMKAGVEDLHFDGITDLHRRVLPVFGAHPLSNVFNEVPVLLLEGDDDVRIWQQAARSSDGAIKVYPVSCETVSAMNAYETEVGRIATAVYDSARAFSLRDRDGMDGELNDDPPVRRMRLACRAAENLFLTDEVLASCGLGWTEAKSRIDTWLDANQSHDRYALMLAFRDSGYDRKSFDLKEIRMVLVGMILNSTKPWEVLVGQAIASLQQPTNAVWAPAEDSLLSYLGEKTVRQLLPTII